MTDEEDARNAALAAAVADAISPVEQRQAVEEAQQRNDADLKQMAASMGFGITELSVISVRMQVLIEHLLGDMDMPRRLDYETMVQAKFSELIADGRSKLARTKLLDGVHLDPRQQRPNG